MVIVSIMASDFILVDMLRMGEGGGGRKLSHLLLNNSYSTSTIVVAEQTCSYVNRDT